MELSVVLVVIGLIAGGILVGRDLIEAAKVRATIAHIDTLNDAAATFEAKYNCVPGDCGTATYYFGTGVCARLQGPAAGDAGHWGNATDMTSGTCNGDGNGLIHSDPSFCYEYGEPTLFFDHLIKAGLIGGAPFLGPYQNIYGTGSGSNRLETLPSKVVSR